MFCFHFILQNQNFVKVVEPQLGPSVGTLYFGLSGKHYVALKPKQKVPLVTFMCYMYGKQMCLDSFQNLATCYIRFLTNNQPVWLTGSSVHSSDIFFWVIVAHWVMLETFLSIQ